MDDPSTTYFVFQAGEPSIEFLGALEGIHAPHCIRRDTNVQSRMQGEWYRYGRPNVLLCGGPARWLKVVRRLRPVRTS